MMAETAELDVTPRFAARGPFSRDLQTEAEAYFEGHGRSRRDVPRMYVKSAIIIVWFVSSWVLLVFFARNGVEATLAAASVGLGIDRIGMSVQHDANHGATSKHLWVNRLFGMTLDFMGVAAFIWRQKHNVGHHTYTNIQGIDYDLDFGVLGRMSAEQPRRPWHRWQHLYIWFFYGFLLPKWVFYDDWVVLFGKFIGKHPLVKPSRGKVAGFFVCKVFFVGWAIVIPAMFHPLWQVLVFHMVGCFALGLTLGTVFQLAHCSQDAEFPPPPLPGERMPEWTAHQLATTVDFAPRSAVITWFVGGLNYQAVHHLFPKVSHVHYPALSQIVSRLAVKHGLRYRSHRTLFGALTAHFLHLRALGRALPVRAAVPVLAADSEPNATAGIEARA